MRIGVKTPTRADKIMRKDDAVEVVDAPGGARPGD
jgi:hypothetical protein